MIYTKYFTTHNHSEIKILNRFFTSYPRTLTDKSFSLTKSHEFESSTENTKEYLVHEERKIMFTP